MKLELQNIVFGYHQPLFTGLSLSLSPGDFTFLLGANGSGKSTLLNLASGFLTPQAGTVLLNGKKIVDWRPRERAKIIAIVPQTPPPPLDFTVEEIVSFGRNPYRSPLASLSEKDHAVIKYVLDLLSLNNFTARSINQLSGGERARVLLAAALAQEPRFLLLDEPTAALDPAQTIHLLNLLRDLTRSLPAQIGILISIHDLSVVAEFAQSAVLLKTGEIFARGAIREVFTKQNIIEIYGAAAAYWVKQS